MQTPLCFFFPVLARSPHTPPAPALPSFVLWHIPCAACAAFDAVRCRVVMLAPLPPPPRTLAGGIVEQVKVPSTIAQQPLGALINAPVASGEDMLLTPDLSKFGRPALLHVIFHALDLFAEKHGGACGWRWWGGGVGWVGG
jgi:hypothetical protein